MTTHQPGPDRIDALLHSYAPNDPAQRYPLDAAGAPAQPGELRGEHAALAAFRAAAISPAAAWSRPAGKQRTLATVLSVKAVAAALALTGMGGVALAASTGTLPGPIDGSQRATEQVDQERTSAGAAPATPADSSAAGTPDKAAAAAAQAAQKLAALRARSSDEQLAAAFGRMCRAFGNADAAERERPAQSRAFRRLIAAAGSVDSVPAFCVAVAAVDASAAQGSKSTDKRGRSTVDPDEAPAGSERGNRGTGTDAQGKDRADSGPSGRAHQDKVPDQD